MDNLKVAQLYRLLLGTAHRQSTATSGKSHYHDLCCYCMANRKGQQQQQQRMASVATLPVPTLALAGAKKLIIIIFCRRRRRRCLMIGGFAEWSRKVQLNLNGLALLLVESSKFKATTGPLDAHEMDDGASRC